MCIRDRCKMRAANRTQEFGRSRRASSTEERRGRRRPSPRRSDDDERSHHVVFLVLQDVAMPHVFVAARARACRYGKGGARQIELHDHGGALAWIHPDRFLPAELVGIGRPRWAEEPWTSGVERLTRDDLDVDEMKVDRM